GEDGVEVDAVGPEPGYVVEVFTYTAYGPAEAGAGERAADALFRTAAGDAPAGAGEAVREDVIYDGVQRPFRDAGDVRAVVEGELEVFRALLAGLAEKDLAGVIEPLIAHQLEIVIEPVEHSAQLGLPPVAVLAAEHESHLRRIDRHGRLRARGVAIPERAALQVASCAAQPEYRGVLVEAEGVFAHWPVKYRVLY